MGKTAFRIFKDRLFKTATCLLGALSLLPLFLIILQIFLKGAGAVNYHFFTRLTLPPGETGGGILNALLGTLMLIVMSFAFSVPPGILAGILLSEVNNKFTLILRVSANLLQGIPSIVIGIICYIWIVAPLHHFSAFSGGIALALTMLPIVVKSTEETLRLIPFSLKEASYALGVNHTRTVFKVILPAAAGGISSGIAIGISRAAGETAPLLFTAFGSCFLNLNPLKPVDSVPLLIFNYAMSPYSDWHKTAWAASLVLAVFILMLNIVVRILAEKWKIQY